MENSDDRYLRSLIAQGEHRQLDFKYEISDARKIARTFSAFSNTEGGRLLVGVKDNGRISGVRSDEEYYMVESAAALYSKPEVKFDTRQRQAEGKTVLEVYIPPVVRKPVYAKDEKGRWMAYVRVNDENMLASIVQLRVWQEEHKARGELLEFTRDEQILLETMSRFPPSTLQKLNRDTGFGKDLLVSLLTKLVHFDVVQIIYEDKSTLFGLKEKPGE